MRLDRAWNNTNKSTIRTASNENANRSGDSAALSCEVARVCCLSHLCDLFALRCWHVYNDSLSQPLHATRQYGRLDNLLHSRHHLIAGRDTGAGRGLGDERHVARLATHSGEVLTLIPQRERVGQQGVRGERSVWLLWVWLCCFVLLLA